MSEGSATKGWVVWGLVVMGLSLIGPTPRLWAVQAFQEAAGQVVMEAENADGNIARGGKTWQSLTTTSGFSGTAYMSPLPNTGANITTGYTTTSPELTYNVTFSTTGTYYVWVRGAGSTDDTVHVGLDGDGTTSDHMNGFTSSWNWKRATSDGPVATILVSSPGLHTVNVWMQEDGFQYDKILLRTDSSVTAPSGAGPVESPRVTVGGDTTPPTVSITAPAGGATVSGTITISANAGDNIGVVGVQFKLDGANLGAEDTTSPYSVSWNTTTATNAGHALTAVARDAAGNSTTSAAVSVTVNNVPPDTTPPVISAVTASGITVSGATVTWTTDEASTSQVDYGTTTGYGQTTPLNASLVTSHSVGLSGLSASTLYHYRVRSKDAAGNERLGTDATFTTAAAGDTTPPTNCSIIIESGAAATRFTTVTLTLSASDPSGVTQMQFSNTGSTYSAAEAYATSRSWTLATGDGTKTVYVKFKDAANNWSNAVSDTITLDTTPPQLSITSPANGAVISSPTP